MRDKDFSCKNWILWHTKFFFFWVIFWCKRRKKMSLYELMNLHIIVKECVSAHPCKIAVVTLLQEITWTFNTLQLDKWLTQEYTTNQKCKEYI